MNHFIEITVVTDSQDTLVKPRKALLRVDRITSVSDVSEGQYINNVLTMIGTDEPGDFINTDDEAGGVVRAERSLFVQESYQAVRNMIEAATVLRAAH